MKASLDSVRAAFTRCAAFAGKWLLTIFVAVAAFALAAQALALVLAALALLVIALCLASMCMPEESRAVWAWMRDTLGRWSAVAGTDKTDEAQSPDEPVQNESAQNESVQAADTAPHDPQKGDSWREQPAK
ncbi:hypothetical protein KUD97_06940 [Desulfovibrio desulfuricans]|uniref:hypothetical protein n=1 Tax=Desulfovibrio desulfuricans TaxID=876 RepID=UPI001F271D65|nr:hypothetical protein [Desulfovibrio desulfuricans]UIB01359.1 hypothetical protein KUD97_06940 [Desulfovibrio desulfuricans]